MKAILLFSGNAQGRDSDSGPEELFKRVRLHASANLTTYHPRTWKSNIPRFMDHLHRMNITDLFMGGYSHGQVPVMEIARRAPYHGISSIRVALCDPVWRSPWLPKWAWAQALSIRSLMSHPKIIIPATIQRVDWCRQYIDWPRAHDLIAEDHRKTFIAEPYIIPRSHSRIQWDALWFHQVETAIEDWIAPPKGIVVEKQ